MSLNPFCEIAIEEAVRLKEKKIVSEVICLSIGNKQAQETLRTGLSIIISLFQVILICILALAIGADKAIHVTTDLRTDQDIQPLAVAKILKTIAEREKVDLIILGKQAIDGDNCQTGPLVAGLLGWSQCTFAANINIVDVS